MSLLQPFKHATEEICGDNYVVVNRLYAVFNEIREHLTESSKKSAYSLYKTVIDKMSDKLKDYWEKIKPFAIITNGLDPRFKIDLMTRQDKQIFTDILTDKLNSINSNSLSLTAEQSSQNEEKKLSLTEKLMQRKKLVSNASDEIENYLSTPRLNPISSNPLIWWKDSKETYPLLSRIAAEYLSCVPSSTSSERGLSTSGQFITKDRSSLSNERAAKLVQLCSWEKL